MKCKARKKNQWDTHKTVEETMFFAINKYQT